MSAVKIVTVAAADDGVRLDRWFRQHFPALKHGQLQKLLRKGQIRVDGGRAAADRRVTAGEAIRVPPIDTSSDDSPKTPKPVSAADADFVRSLVLYEDDDVIAINKPFGLAVQGGTRTTRHLDGMLGELTVGGERPRLVHRLDRDTGGLMFLGRTRKSAAMLSEAFKTHAVKKTYWALTRRVPHPLSGRIDLSVEKKMAGTHEKMTPVPGGKKAVTDFQVVEMAGQRAAFVALRPETGRTHQIRVHLSALNTPIVGDRKYGGKEAVMEGLPPHLHLFCRSMSVPIGGKLLSLTAPLTDHMKDTWAFFSFSEPTDLEWPE